MKTQLDKKLTARTLAPVKTIRSRLEFARADAQHADTEHRADEHFERSSPWNLRVVNKRNSWARPRAESMEMNHSFCPLKMPFLTTPRPALRE
jgi:hypothetical protein